MRLHNNIKLFDETIRAAAQNSGINVVFTEKDYWITYVLHQLAKSKNAENAVFKGGTSLSKGFELINRFSEDVDIAIINGNNTGNEIKTIIRNVEKEMTKGLIEKHTEGISSKGSRFRKSVFEYKSIDTRNITNKLIVEVNSFANPFPFEKKTIRSFVHDFLAKTGNEKYINEYHLHPFEINILNKEQTLLEKLVSLIRFSFDENPVAGLSSRIRHFYDLYFLLQDEDCSEFVNSEKFKNQFNLLIMT